MSLRMRSNQRGSRANDLEKRVPRNPRYAGVKSNKVETGMTVDKVNFVTTRQHLRRQEEPYFRLTPAQLGELLSEYEQQDQQEGVHDFRDHIDPDHHGPKVVEHDPDARPSYDRPYLILDVRPPQDYEGCRIMQARSFEAKLLNQDRMTREMFMYKNREGGLVVLYSNEDAEACHAARTLIHRGFDNVFVLSGGLVAFVRGGFHYFVEGDVGTLPLQAAAAAPATTRGGGGVGGGARSRIPNGSLDGEARVGSENLSNSASLSRIGGSDSGGRLDYRHRGGPSVVVRGAGRGVGKGGTTSCGGGGSSKDGSVSEVVSTASARMGAQQSVISTHRGGRGGGGGGDRGRDFGGYPGGQGSGKGAAPRVPAKGGCGGGGSGGRLAEAAAAASAARRRSMQGGESEGRGGVDMSRGSAVTVADSVILRSTARRGRW